jgi:hypothetical protein
MRAPGQLLSSCCCAGAFGQKALRASHANAFAAAGDEDVLVAKVKVHGALFC